MRLIHLCAGTAVLAVLVSAGASAQAVRYTPPRLLRADLPPEPPATVIGGGEVLIEFIVDVRGAVTRPIIVRSTPPYTQMVLEAIARWQFQPARAADERGIQREVQAPITVSALFRPPTLYNGPSLGESPTQVARPSGDVAYPLEIVPPVFPPNTLFGSVLLYEIGLNDSGQLVEARGLAPASGFDSAARDSLAKMRFQGASYRARPAPSVTYVMFGFRQPTTFASPVPAPTPR